MKSQAANEAYARDVQNTMGSLSNLASIGMSADFGGLGGGKKSKGGI